MLKISFVKIYRLLFFFTSIPGWPVLLLLLWFIPWVFMLHLGLLVYFPYHSDGDSRFIRLTGPALQFLSRDWVHHQDIPSMCRSSLVASEDANFYEHNGIDLESIKENFYLNQRLKRIKRGGSTITQQLVKNAFLARERSYIRKAREILGALMLDSIMPKKLQQTWYFNIIEFGPEIYGIQQASEFYFGIDAKNLTPSQCVALTTIIPSPRKWNKGLREKRPTSFFTRRFYRIIARVSQMHLESPALISQSRRLDFWSQNKVRNKNKNKKRKSSNSNSQTMSREL